MPWPEITCAHCTRRATEHCEDCGEVTCEVCLDSCDSAEPGEEEDG